MSNTQPTKQNGRQNGNGKTPAKRRPRDVSAEILDRVPPVNLEAEYGVLGSMLINNECCDDVLMHVSVADFYDDLNATCFGTMEEMWNAGRAIDVTTLAEQLRKRMEADNDGKAKESAVIFLAKITSAVPNAAHAVYYAKIVREKSVYRTLINSATEILRDAYDESGSAEDLAAAAEQKLFEVQERTAAEPEPVKNLIVAAMESIERRRSGELEGISTGFSNLDGKLGRMRPGELIVVAARPSMGKTAFVLNLIERTCLEHETKCLFISLEMSNMELMDRLLSGMSRVDLNRMRGGTLRENECQKIIEASDRIHGMPLWVDDTPGLKTSQIATKARRIKRRFGLDLIVVDYLQFIQEDDARAPREQQVARISKNLKHIAKSVGVPVIVVAQLNRKAEEGSEPRPKLSHLRESGSVEQDADVVMFLHRPEYYLSPEEREKRKEEGDAIIGQAEIIVAKQRNGPIGTVPLRWFDKYARFEEPAPDRHQEFDNWNDQQ